ncbi:MAG TPA: recombination protein RecR [Candidatus Coprenecus stercorigallinarum]|nr:recombination protein RecR [Candidatus Coprenecus stercorigallinarum]
MTTPLMIPLLQEAVDSLRMLPSIGEKTALRLALHLLRRPQEETERLGNALIALRTRVRYCRICNMISEEEICPVCADTRRDHSLVCVVESIRDVISIEETGEYNGVYHVLGGVISPMDGIGPDDLPIAQLVGRVSSGGVREVIIAISKGMEGETTSFYINRLLSGTGVRVTTIARGVGFGDELENADSLTLGMSIKNRTPLL